MDVKLLKSAINRYCADRKIEPAKYAEDAVQLQHGTIRVWKHKNTVIATCDLKTGKMEVRV